MLRFLDTCNLMNYIQQKCLKHNMVTLSEEIFTEKTVLCENGFQYTVYVRNPCSVLRNQVIVTTSTNF